MNNAKLGETIREVMSQGLSPREQIRRIQEAISEKSEPAPREKVEAPPAPKPEAPSKPKKARKAAPTE